MMHLALFITINFDKYHDDHEHITLTYKGDLYLKWCLDMIIIHACHVWVRQAILTLYMKLWVRPLSTDYLTTG